MEQTKEKAQTIEEKLEAVKNNIVANSKDAKWAKDLLDSLTFLQKQADIEAVELIVPTKNVKKEYNLNETIVIKETPQGYLFHCRSGFDIFVPTYIRGLYEMLSEVCDFIENPSPDKEEEEIRRMYINAVSYIFQAPIFACAVSVEGMLDMATFIISKFNEYCTKEVENATLKEETKQDVIENADSQKVDAIFNESVKTDLPE